MNGPMRLMLTAALSLLGAACSLERATVSLPHVHDFGPEAAVQSGAASWTVASIDAPAWLQDDRIRYRLLYADPSQVRFYTRDLWAAPPPQLLAQRLDVAGRGGGGYRLRVNLGMFEQVFDAPERARAVLNLSVAAYQPGAAQPFAERRFRFDEPTPSADAPGAVTAFTRLADQAAAEIRAWLTGLQPALKP